MRIRSIRPEFWSSEDVAAMDWKTRLVFIGLWSYVDDNGVGRDVERLITTALFPLDEDLRESSRSVTGALRHLSDHGQITRYTVDGKPYLHITAWAKHQRIEKASKGRYPLPTCENAEIRESSPTTPRLLPEPSTPGEGEKGRRGEGEKSLSVTADAATESEPDPFDEFWAAYPRKVGKPAARKAWRAAVKRADASVIMTGLRRTKFKDDPDFVPHPTTWLTQDRWADQPAQGVIPLRPSADGFTAAELDQIVGPPPPLPQPPRDLSADAMWEWEQQTRREQRAERVRQANAKLGRSA